MEKKILRKKIINNRDLLDIDCKEKLDNLILNNLMEQNILENYENIFCYVNFGSEINTFPIMEFLLQNRKNLYVPYIDKKNNLMKLSLIKDLKSDLEPGYYNIPEPKNFLRKSVDNNIIDLVITPGVAFTKNKYRMGYGGGFYDRFFASLKKSPLKIALAYDFQIVDELPIEVYDIPVDIVITENQIIK
ncbi:5-formyltetrahydrofolate cyclo-ligase [Miniphocaeibacter massiliensis]|uniref:5-formyltetrahydrofolate cyclo-ligase n=1 Tax=Miniphocaeibacter massiliensis TaxID=2041841 RepID=UPI0013EAFF40|nr:5-formyltetrahydrofolate cyclo-ligase [Miniphocaeibacter massiliensis]